MVNKKDKSLDFPETDIPSKTEIAYYNKRFGVNNFNKALKRDLKQGNVRFNSEGKIVQVKASSRAKKYNRRPPKRRS